MVEGEQELEKRATVKLCFFLYQHTGAERFQIKPELTGEDRRAPVCMSTIPLSHSLSCQEFSQADAKYSPQNSDTQVILSVGALSHLHKLLFHFGNTSSM